MMDGTFRCRKCGCFLFTAGHLVNDQRIENEENSAFTQWFLKHESCPEWAEQSILKEQYTRGKLICPKCQGRIGAFDFVGKREHFQLGPVWVQKCRVDLIKHITVAPVPKRPTVNLPLLGDDGIPNEYSGSERLAQENIEMTSLPSTESGSFLIQPRTIGGTEEVIQGNIESFPNIDDEDTIRQSDGASTSMLTFRENRFSPLAVDEDPARREVQEEIYVEHEPKEEREDPGAEGEVENAYTCPICLDVLFQAHTCRPCLHVYCAPCLRRLCGASPFNTKCPLCRQVIAACLPNHEMSNIVKTVFPKEYNQRKTMEKKNRRKLPPLPSSSTLTFTHFNRDRNRNYVVVHWAGVCFVVLLIVMAISILATTVGMLLWYLWETFMDYFIDGLVSVNGYFDYSWQLIIMILLEKSDEISPELAKMLAGSFGQVLHAVGKLFNRSVEMSMDVAPTTDKKPRKENAQMNYVISAFQVDLANYVLVMCVVTYLIYRFARYRQARQVEATQLR